MGRELRRKQAKKEGKSLEVVEKINDNPLKKYLINVICIVAIITTIYLISALFITKELDWFGKKEDTKDTNEKDSSVILAVDTFKQTDESYYVYFYNFEEKETDSKITALVNTIYNTKVYKVNTNSRLNANYVGEESNKSASSLDELKVIAPTLIKIENETITEYYEGNEIADKLS